MNRLIARIDRFYINPIERRRALGLTIMNGLVVIAWLVASYTFTIAPLLRGETPGTASILPVLITPVLIVTIQYLVINGGLQRATWLFVGMTLAVVLVSAYPNLYGTWAVVFLWPVVIAGLLLNQRGLSVVTGIVLLGIIWAAINQSQLAEAVTFVPSVNLTNDLITFLIAIFIVWAFMRVFGGGAEALSQEIEHYDYWLEMLGNYRGTVARPEDENGILIHTSQLLTEKLSYSFVQSHLADSEGRLFTYTRTGMGTQHAITRTDLDIDNAIPIASRTQAAVLVGPGDPYEKRAHLLTSVKQAVALPLVVNEHCLGVLDIQSNADTSPFNDGELRLLSILAAEMAQALDRVRQTNEFQQNLNDQALANQRLQAEITELRRRVDHNLGGVWEQYFQSRHQQLFGFDVNGRTMELTPATDLPAHLKPAMLKGEIVIEPGQREQIINLPITRRNEVLGAMSFVVPGNQKISDRQIEMARSVANRLSVALDNARLVEQSQAQANRERKAGEVSNILLGQQEVHDLLDTAAASFQEALGAVYTRIYIEPGALREETP